MLRSLALGVGVTSWVMMTATPSISVVVGKFWPATKPYHCAPPSMVRKLKTSVRCAVDVRTGALPASQITDAGQFALLLPKVSCWRKSLNEHAVPTGVGLEKAKVQPSVRTI